MQVSFLSEGVIRRGGALGVGSASQTPVASRHMARCHASSPTDGPRPPIFLPVLLRRALHQPRLFQLRVDEGDIVADGDDERHMRVVLLSMAPGPPRCRRAMRWVSAVFSRAPKGVRLERKTTFGVEPKWL